MLGFRDPGWGRAMRRQNWWRALLMFAFFLTLASAFLRPLGEAARGVREDATATQTTLICLAVMLAGLACSHPRR